MITETTQFCRVNVPADLPGYGLRVHVGLDELAAEVYTEMQERLTDDQRAQVADLVASFQMLKGDK